MPLTGEALVRVQGDVSGAVNSLNTLNNSLKNAATATDKLKTQTVGGMDQFAKFKGGIGTVVQQMTGFSIASLGAAGAVGLVGKSIIDATRESMKYSLAVGDLSTKLGITTQEASKFYQIADDLRVSTQSLELGFRMLTRNGIQPNTENIMRLADEYNAIVDPVQKAQFAMDKFGSRAGLEMARMLDAGSDAIGRMADEAEKFGLVVDEKAAANAKEFYLMLDKLKDRLEGVKIALGGGIIKLIVEEGDAMEEAAKKTDYRREAYKQFIEQGIHPTTAAVSVLAGELEREARAAAIAAEGTGQLFGDAIRQLKGDLLELPSALQAAAAAFREQTQATVEGYLKAQEYKAGIADITAAIAALQSKHIEITVTTITEEITRQTWEWRTGLNTPNTGDDETTGGEQRARGGPLAPITEVGEEGTEGIIGNQVIPHEQWEAMKRAGVVASRRMGLGGTIDVDVPTTSYATPTSFNQISVMQQALPTYWGTQVVHPGEFRETNPDAWNTNSTTATAAAIAATAAATASAAAEAAAVSVASTMPRAISQGISQQTAQQVQIQLAGNAAQTAELRAVRREIRNLNTTMVRAVRDAVASL